MNEADYTTLSLEKIAVDEEKPTVDIGNLYTPDYFKRFGIFVYTSDTVDETEMVGGYFQPIEKLTKPYQYFVYMTEPFTFTLPTFTKANNPSLVFQPPPKTEPNNKNVGSPPSVDSSGSYLPSFVFDFSKIKNMILKPEYQDKPVVEQNPPPTPTMANGIDPSLNTTPETLPPIKEEETKKTETETEINKETPAVSSPPPTPSPLPLEPTTNKLSIKIKQNNHTHHPFQKKTVQEIIDFYKDKPRTIDMFQNHLTYVLVEFIIKDIHRGLLYLLKTVGVMTETINLSACYHINQRYVYLDNTGFILVGKNDTKNQEMKLHQMIKECIERLIGDVKIEHTYLYKEYLSK